MCAQTIKTHRMSSTWLTPYEVCADLTFRKTSRGAPESWGAMVLGFAINEMNVSKLKRRIRTMAGCLTERELEYFHER